MVKLDVETGTVTYGTSRLGITVDPTGHFDGVEQERLFQAAGYLPGWVLSCPDDYDMERWVREQYQFPAMDMSGTMTDDGIYKYPEDPDLHPMFKMWNHETTVYFYQHAIISFKKNGIFSTTRMD
jgi:hypothetical protein